MTEKNKNYHFSFTAHALERGLERMFGVEAPYDAEQLTNIKKLIIRSMEWNGMNCKWVLHEYKLELVVKNHKVVSIVPYYEIYETKPVSDYMKAHTKKPRQQENKRNKTDWK